MSISLKELLEGDTKSHKGGSYVYVRPTMKKGLGQGLKSMQGLIDWLNEVVIEPLEKTLPDAISKEMQFDILTADMSDYEQDWGDLVVEIGQFPEMWWPKVLGGLEHFIRAAGVTTGKWKRVGKDYQVDKMKVIIPVMGIASMTPKGKTAPDHMIYAAALEKIKYLIGLNDSFDINGASFTMSIPTGKFYDALVEYMDLWEKHIAPAPPTTQILSDLESLKTLAEWAIKNHYPYLEAK